MSSCAANPEDANASTAPPKKCVPCSSMDPSALLTKEQVHQRLQSTPSLAMWKLGETLLSRATAAVPMLMCEFTTKNFQAAMDAIQAMGTIAERENHHPDFHLTNYRDVRIEIFTHKLQGITENDIALAEMFSQEIKISYSPKWLKEHPEALPTSM